MGIVLVMLAAAFSSVCAQGVSIEEGVAGDAPVVSDVQPTGGDDVALATPLENLLAHDSSIGLGWLAAGGVLLVVLLAFWGQYRRLRRRLERMAVLAESLERQKKIYTLLSQTNQAIGRCIDRDGLFNAVVHIAAAHDEIRFASIGLTATGGTSPIVRRHAKSAEDVDPEVFQALPLETEGPSGYPYAEAVLQGNYSVSNDLLADAQLKDTAAQTGARAAGLFPLRCAGRVVGTFHLYAEPPGFFQGDVLETLAQIATDLSFALDNLERKNALTTVTQVVEASPVVLFRWLPQAGWPVAYVSENVARWGYAAADFLSGDLAYSDIIHPEDRPRVEVEVAAQINAKEEAYLQKYRIRTADRETLWVEDRSLLVRDATGNVTHFEGLVVDVTERERIDAESQRRKALVEVLLAHAPIGLAISTLSDGRRIFVGQRFEAIYGVPTGSLNDVEDFFEQVYPDPETRQAIRDRVLTDIASGDPARMRWEDLPLLTRAGAQRYISASNIPLPDQDLMISTVQDVTERHEVLARLAEQVEELRRWQEATLGRELRSLELKQEVNALLAEAGQPPRYPSALPEATRNAVTP